jgi:hypothetical protein
MAAALLILVQCDLAALAGWVGWLQLRWWRRVLLAVRIRSIVRRWLLCRRLNHLASPGDVVAAASLTLSGRDSAALAGWLVWLGLQWWQRFLLFICIGSIVELWLRSRRVLAAQPAALGSWWERCSRRLLATQPAALGSWWERCWW